MFHKHNWVEVERFYAYPTEIQSSGGSGHGYREFIEKCAFGQTTILYKCSSKFLPIREHQVKEFIGCGKTYIQEILGKKL